MPKMVERLDAAEQLIAQQVEQQFTIEQQCAYYLVQTVRSVFQMDDKSAAAWRLELGDDIATAGLSDRQAIVSAYTKILMIDQKYKFHLEYWTRHFQSDLIAEIETFLSGKPPHQTSESQHKFQKQ